MKKARRNIALKCSFRLKRIHEKGIHVCVWINPYIAQASELFQEGMERGYFLHRENGDVWQWDKWQAGMAIVDFTNPEANYLPDGKWTNYFTKEATSGGRWLTETVDYFTIPLWEKN